MHTFEQQQQEKWRLQILQGIKHQDCVKGLFQEFSHCTGAEVFLNEDRQCISFSTYYHADFVPLARIFVNPQGKKHCSDYFSKNKITPGTLAYWFMDDGGLLSYNKDCPRRGTALNTHSLSRKECEILVENLKSTYNFHSWCKKKRGKTIAAFPGEEWLDLARVISPYILTCAINSQPLPTK